MGRQIEVAHNATGRTAQRSSLPWAEAYAAAAGAAEALPAEQIELSEAAGRVLAADVTAQHDVPHYASSAMDGWAVAGSGPWNVADPLGGHLGDATVDGQLRPGRALPIVTGALVPEGADAVLRSENGEVRAGHLTLNTAGISAGDPHPGQHIRPRAQEAREGDLVIARGTVVNPAHIAVAALCALDTLLVVRQPRVAFVFTGDEVDERGTPKPGRVRDTFGPQLPSGFRMLGALPLGSRRCPDDLEATIAAVAEASAGANLLVTTGGTGGSPADHLRSALRTLKARILIDGVAMRPGSPTLLARLPSGTFVICLPGNPLAAMMGVLTVAVPLVAALSGDLSVSSAPRSSRAVAGAALAGKAETTLLLPGTLLDGVATPNPWTGSGMMRGLAEADGVLVVPSDGIEAGEPVRVLKLPWPQR
ncbi:molybdopterin molybdotransferase MoeA [Subtercola sp. PAMC28395]|nr:molybdopterin molybdotransferase MoeA [Subtercola sp. PAMC28395]